MPDTEFPEAFHYTPSGSEQLLFRDLLAYLDAQGVTDSESRAVIAFTLSDGTHCFSLVDPINILFQIMTESVHSDRLLVIVSVAYLEDQIRLLLLKYLADDDVARDLLDPNKSMLASLVPMANLAFSMGLLAKEWLETLKRIARLRNTFAHVPTARSFEDLIGMDTRTAGLLDSLQERFRQLMSDADSYPDDFAAIYQQLFLAMHNRVQFAIDHIASPSRRSAFDGQKIEHIRMIQGTSKALIQQYANHPDV